MAIQASGLSKRYWLGEHQHYVTLRDSLAGLLTAPARRLARLAQGRESQRGTGSSADSIWALRDVDLEIEHGDIVGFVGRNGAGKTTLLKILSRITAPDTGRAIIHGRIGSLLEVGTGFHPELTGRENVFLNGAILGMRRHEIKRRFDEIVEFGGVERFIDTPVKRYSSGMYMRLAFAVAAHLDTEILMVDEVLAVGDIAFQQKCLGKMGDVARDGRTVLFVSHNLVALQSLCNRAYWIDQGRIVNEGAPGNVVANYLQASYALQTEQVWEDPATAPGNDVLRLQRVSVRPSDSSAGAQITVRTPLRIEFDYQVREGGVYLQPSLSLYNSQGIQILSALDPEATDWRGTPLESGVYRETCLIPGDLLNSGMHRIEFRVLIDGQDEWRANDVLIFDVLDAGDFRAGWYEEWEGVIRPLLPWRRERLK
ncbi:MAG TPA: polysaccharide ABC transporter ATP-binding protein [Thermomicrobiales bacterium]|nr:polysaccharide ABC transporter ATP-binding protein [Thermomicrobiales bacterium]